MKGLNALKINAKYGVLVLSLAFVFVGISIREEHKIVLRKAINICLECIGVG